MKGWGTRVAMETNDQQKRKSAQRGQSHMPENSLFYEKVIPILLIVLGIVMVALIVFAAAVLMGVIKF